MENEPQFRAEETPEQKQEQLPVKGAEIPKPGNEKLKKEHAIQEKSDKEHDELTANRLVENEDLNEVAEKLKGSMLNVKKYMDGAEHCKRASQKENRVILIPELQKELDTLNNAIKHEKEAGKQF